MARRSRVATSAMIVGLLTLSGGVAAETAPVGSDPEDFTTTETVTEDVDGAAAARAGTAKRRVNVYWGYVMPTHPVSPERLGAGARMVDAMTPARGAMTKLLAGPNVIETDIGMLTSIPAGTTLNGISIAKTGVATVDLSAEFTQPSGSLAETTRLGQVVFTLTQFDNVNRVKFQIDGVPTDPILSHGFVVGKGLRRSSFNGEIRPLVMVERPHPGARVTSPLVVRGESNTFEATVRYILTDQGGDGRVIAEGFTTASAGMGTWGTYRFAIDLDSLPEYDPGPGAIIVWDENTESGGMGATVEYPIVLPSRCHGHAPTILGTPWGDVITGTDGPDVILARAGDDRVAAARGEDLVCLGPGNDIGNGQKGRDQVSGGLGRDILFGMNHNDRLSGGEGPDDLRGGAGDDHCDGGPGIADTAVLCENLVRIP